MPSWIREILRAYPCLPADAIAAVEYWQEVIGAGRKSDGTDGGGQ